MNIVEQPVEVDGERLMQFVFRAVDEVGATLNAALVVMGDKLGLYRAMAGTAGVSPVELAQRTGTAERYVREWLNAQTAGGFVTYDPVGRAYYAFSTLLCTPASLSQEIGLALGAQAGEARIRNVVEMGGFTRLRRVAETPFNMVLEAKL